MSAIYLFLLRRIPLALLSVAFTLLAFPGKPFPWLAWIALVPLAWSLREAKPLEGFTQGALYGLLFWFGMIWWIQAPLRDILGLSAPVAFALTLLGSAFFALSFAIACWLVCLPTRIESFFGRSIKNAAIFCVVISWFPVLFEGNLAHTQYQNPRALQIVDLGGVPLLLFLMLWANWLVVEVISRIRTFRRAAKPVGVLLVLLVALFGYGRFRLNSIHAQMNVAPPASWFKVGSIQPNIPLPIAPEIQPVPPIDRTNDFFSSLQQAEKLAHDQPGIDLLAFPENPDLFIFNTDSKRRAALAETIRITGKPVVLNATLFDSRKLIAGQPGRYNVNVFVDASGFVTNSYRKMKLVPVVETLPGETTFALLRDIFPRSLGVLHGPRPVLFDIKPGVRVIPLICYEGTTASFPRKFVELGGNIIVNLVNDSWFLRTPASECHLAVSLFRAVEFRVPLVRVTNSGIGAFVQPTGEIVPGSKTKLFEKAETAFPVYIPPQRSFYAKHGNWFLVFLTISAAGVLIRDGRRLLAMPAAAGGGKIRIRRRRR